MKFTADEGVDAPIVKILRENGHDVFYIAEEEPSIPDTDVLDIASLRHDILITQDKDFGELVFKNQLPHNGVILIRLAGITAKDKAQKTLDVVNFYGESLHDSFVVIQVNKVRHRPIIR